MRYFYLVLLFKLVSASVLAQTFPYNFHKITTLQGLSSNTTNTVCQDKLGYIWIGNGTGVNRYNGYEVKNYENIQEDSCAIYSGGMRAMLCDTKGRLWMGLLNGFVEYDYEKDCFKKIGDGKLPWVNIIKEVQPEILFLGLRMDGLVKIDTRNYQVTHIPALKNNSEKLFGGVIDIAQIDRDLYLGTEKGIFVYNLDSEKFREIQMPPVLKGRGISEIKIDSKGRIWCSVYLDPALIYQTNIRFDTWKAYYDLDLSPSSRSNSISDILIDKKSRMWVSTAYSGIALYDTLADKFRPIPVEPWMPTGFPSIGVRQLYEDREGNIWCSSRKGAVFFDPDNTMFESIIPGNAASADENLLSARAFAEMDDGKLWFGTGAGLFHMDPVTGKTQRYWNEKGKPLVIHDNSVRALFVDKLGDLWIGTAKGMNRLRKGSRNIEFLDEKHGIPKVVTKAIHESRDGTMWIANFGQGGHYYRPPGEKKFRSIAEHPVLGQYQGYYGQCILEDSRGCLWFGLDGNGLTYFDPIHKVAKYWRRTPTNDSTLLGNFIYSMTEDAKGRIWAATLEGISVIDPTTFQFTNYSMRTGLPTNLFLNIRADSENRIWVGTLQGLMLLNDSGQLLRQFNLDDGLVENGFSDRPSYEFKNGRFCFPTTRGFLTFYPERYKDKEAKTSLMLSEVRVFNKVFQTNTNAENLKELYLPPSNNFFSLEMLALNFTNAHQTWYAYKMEPYDKDWVITRDRRANYTDVPSGHYIFRYKASNNANDWNVPEKTLKIRVDQHWYKSSWFWGLILGLLAALGIAAYRRREQMKKAFFSLEQKAQALSKEKAVVQYENLTQQLNPHFLFNSLASLGSLIRFDQKTASEFLEALSKMYRYILQSRDRETVTLQDEIDFAKNFIKLQQTRFGEALEVHFKVEAANLDRKIVPVTLQNLLENALKHNTFDSSEPLVVDIFSEPNYLVVRNNLQLRSVVETSNKQGLSRLRSLYQYLSNNPMEILTTETHFIIRIPLL
ncbi:MAG: two-component regulator propeller domain-containing protein [Saprospiraceae bacterium]